MKRFIFISPHLDDAALSAGQYIHNRIKSKEQLKIITLFTKFIKPKTNSYGWEHMKTSGYKNAKLFEHARKNEDKRAMKKLGAMYAHINKIDASFRQDEFQNLLYPTAAKVFSGRINRMDESLVREIFVLLKKMVRPGDILFTSIGIGNHVDHIIARSVVSKLPNEKYFWLDQPYAMNNPRSRVSREYHLTLKVPTTLYKGNLIASYTSQKNHLFPDGWRQKDEIFYERNPSHSFIKLLAGITHAFLPAM